MTDHDNYTRRIGAQQHVSSAAPTYHPGADDPVGDSIGGHGRLMDPIQAELADAARATHPRHRMTAEMLDHILPAPAPWRETGPLSSIVDGPLAPPAERIAALRERLA